MKSVMNYIFKQVASNNLSKNEAKVLLKELKDLKKDVKMDVAIIGMACRFPQAKNPQEYWNNIVNKVNSIKDIPAHRKVLPKELIVDDLYTPGGYLDEIDKFDAAFFRISPQEAKWMSPSHRIMLEVVSSAIEDSGYALKDINGTKTGVYIGHDHSMGKDYREYCIDLSFNDPLISTGSYPGLLSGRVSYIFNLKGPSIIIDSACSSGLVATHLACDALKSGECNMSLVGSVFIRAIGVTDGGMSVVEGNKIRCFDNRAIGSLWGEGIAAILLKPLDKAIADKDNIHAIIKGSALNNDGGMTSGMTAPNAESQEELLTRVWKNLSINPENISYIEAHGTGTKIGDPIEITALTNAFRRFTRKKQFCAIGSVKPNIGHLVSSSGLASLIKVVMALKYKKLPVTINFEVPNRYIDFCNSPVYINDKLRDWPNGGHGLAGINSFGFSGTNCHMIVETAPEYRSAELESINIKENKPCLIVLSARDKDILMYLVLRYKKFLERKPGITLEEISYTAALGRNHFNYRLAIIAYTIGELKDKIELVISSELQSNIDKGIYYGEHKIVPKNNVADYDGKLTAGEKNKLSKKVYTEGKELIEKKVKRKTLLNLLADNYIRGADIQWGELLFNRAILRKSSLPTYPFKKVRHWSDEGVHNVFKFGSLDIKKLSDNVSIDKAVELSPEDVNLLGRKEGEEYTEYEKKLGYIWAFVLGYPEINIYDSFYDLGGDSINLMKIITKIQSEMKVKINYNTFIEQENIYTIAEFLSKSDSIEPIYHYEIPQDESDSKDPYAPFPLTDIQFAYLMGRDSQFELGGVVTHVYTEYETTLDIKRLNICLNKMVARHPMLRAVFLKDGRQRILETIPEYHIHTTDISYLSENEKQQMILAQREKLSHNIFKPEEWPLFMFRALKLSTDLYYLFLGFDMLIADGTSLQLICQEMMRLYHDPGLILPEINFTFRDYMLIYNKFKQSPKYLEDKEYWQQKLEFFPSAPALPLKRDPETIEKPHFKRFQKLYSREELDALKETAKANKVSLSTLLCTAYAEVLAFWSNQYRLAINLTVFNRYPFHEEVNNLVGDFTSVMLLGIELKSNTSFWERAKSIQQITMEALEHRHYDGISFIRDIARTNSLGNKAVMPIVFTSLLHSSDELEGLGDWSQLGEMKMSLSQTPQVFIDNQIVDINGELQVTWDYVEQLFEEYVISAMFDQYISIISDSIKKQIDYSLKPPPNDLALIDQYNTTEEQIPITTLHELFIEQVNKTPENIAVEFDNRQLTYSELHKRSNQVAHYLKEQGLGRNDLIAVTAKRCGETIVNIMGILKAGGAYVAIEPEYPQERKDYIMKHSQCKRCLEPDFYDSNNIQDYSQENIFKKNSDDIAYVIYTSGSTGKPKGVIISHKAAANTILDINNKIQLNRNDRVLGISSMCFDLSVYDIFGTLASGATLVMIPDQRDVRSLIDAVVNKGITIWNSVPAIMGMFLNSIETEPSQQIMAISPAGAGFNLLSRDNQNKLSDYYWSPVFYWEKVNGTLQIGKYSYSDIIPDLFPQFFFITQKGITLENLLKEFPTFESDKIKDFIKDLESKRILVKSILNPVEIFTTQQHLFKNRYSEKITYIPEEFEKYKAIQLNRVYEQYIGNKIMLTNDITYPTEIMNRRTVRKFKEDQRIPFKMISGLLSILKQTRNGNITYFYGSAGGLYPIDVFIYIKQGRVDGLEKGLYYYSPIDNSLSIVSDSLSIELKSYYYTNKTIFQSSAFTLFLIYNAEVNMPRYGGLGYYFACLDAGLMTATIHIMAEYLDIGLCSIGDMKFEDIKSHFKLNENQVLIHIIEGGLKDE